MSDYGEYRVPVTGTRRVAALGVAGALVAGTFGFLGGRASAPAGARDESTVAVASGSDTATAEPGFAESAAETTAAAADLSSRGYDELNGTPGIEGFGLYIDQASQEAALDLLVERTTADGIALHVHATSLDAADPSEGAGEAAEGWQPAPWCFPTSSVRIGASSASATQVAWGPLYTEPRDGLTVTSFAGGYAESTPFFGVFVQTTPGGAVTLTTTDGRSDSAIAANGATVLAVAGAIDDNFSVVVDGPDGTTTSRSVEDLTKPGRALEYRQACEPPPAGLPEPGEPPADPEAAEAAVRETWQRSRDFDGTDQSIRITLVDDPTGVAEAWTALGKSEYANAAGTSTSTITDLVFVSPTEAWFMYDIETTITDFRGRYGIARLGDDGAWRITRSTICQDIALAPGFACEPSAEPITPPAIAPPSSASSGESIVSD